MMKVKDKNTKLLGNGYKHILSTRTREALTRSFNSLIDEVFDIHSDRVWCLDLPTNFEYTEKQVNNFIMCLVNVGQKLGNEDHEMSLASCTGEEIMLRTIINHAEFKIEVGIEEGIFNQNDLDKFNKEMAEVIAINEYAQDMDYEFLFKDNIDKEKMEEVAKAMGFSFSVLDVDTWFEEFVNSNVHINPYINNTYEDIDTKHIRYAKED